MMRVLWPSLAAWLFLLLVSPIGLAALWPFLSARRAPGLLLAPVVGWGLFTYLLWIAGFAGLPFSPWMVWSALLLCSGGGAVLLFTRRRALARRCRQARRFLAVGLALFLACHFYMGLMRSARPDINGQEKFMDLAFFNSLCTRPDIPPLDPWLAGHTINYYYGGYMMAAVWAKALGMAPAVAYNVNLALLFGLGALGAFAAVACLTRRLLWSLVAAVGVMFSANLYALYEIAIRGARLLGIDVWRAARVIADPANPDGNITEFPFFSFAEVGDMHPHAMGVPGTMVVIFLASVWLARREAAWRLRAERARTLGLALLSGLWLAIMGWTNIFDLPSFGMFLFTVVFLARGVDWRRARWSGIGASALWIGAVGGLSGLFLAPFLLTFRAPQAGPLLRFVPVRSDLGEYLQMWGLHLAVVALCFAVASAAGLARLAYGRAQVGATLGGLFLVLLLVFWMATGYLVWAGLATALLLLPILLFAAARSRHALPAWGGLFFCLLLLLGCETVYLVDGYWPRYNTLFKFFYPVWLLLGALLPVMLAEALRRLSRRSQAAALLAAAPLLALFLGSLLYPISVSMNRYTYRVQPPTLDGSAWLERTHRADYAAQALPADAGVIRWLRENSDPYTVILERPGHLSYSRESRISTYSGRLAFIGWINHEQVWRGKAGYEIAPARAADAYRIYTSPDFEAIWPLLVRHGIDYIVVSTLEHRPERGDRPYPPEGLRKFAREAGRQGGRLRMVYDFVGPSRQPGGPDSARIFRIMRGANP